MSKSVGKAEPGSVNSFALASINIQKTNTSLCFSERNTRSVTFTNDTLVVVFFLADQSSMEEYRFCARQPRYAIDDV